MKSKTPLSAKQIRELNKSTRIELKKAQSMFREVKHTGKGMKAFDAQLQKAMRTASEAIRKIADSQS